MTADYGGNKRLCRIGFTLIELVVVIFVVSLVVAISLPSFRHIGANTLKSDARRVASILRYLNETVQYKEKLYLRIILKTGFCIQRWGRRKERGFQRPSGVELQSKGKAGMEVTIFFAHQAHSKASGFISGGEISDDCP